MPHDRARLLADLQQIGLRPGATVMLHASARAIGRMDGGADEIHRAVDAAVAPGGTVMMYVGCGPGFDDVGRGIHTPAQEAELLATLPAFDLRIARANPEFGVLAELFRSSPGTVCSTSVGGRMAARGARARWLVADQPWNYAYGRDSPLHKLFETGGKVLLLGSDHDQVTVLHYAEHVADFPEKRVARYKAPVSRDGARVWVDCEEFDTSGRGVHANWPERFFARIVDDFIQRHRGTAFCSCGRVGDAESVLMDAAKLVAHAMPIMQRQASGETPLGV